MLAEKYIVPLWLLLKYYLIHCENGYVAALHKKDLQGRNCLPFHNKCQLRTTLPSVN